MLNIFHQTMRDPQVTHSSTALRAKMNVTVRRGLTCTLSPLVLIVVIIELTYLVGI